ncbi:XRCC6 protein, partial [Cochlearius cochlearius]|nr:XRCC6 protein [Cochlearius cochlearius]
ETVTLSFSRAPPSKNCFLALEYCKHLKEVTGTETVISRVTFLNSLYFAGSTTLFNALLMKCLEREVMALCRYTARRNTPPCFVALVPQEEEVDEQKVQIAPPGFHVIFLPYADDKRNIDFTAKVPASREQVDKMKEIIQKLRFKYRTDSFENPVLQQHFRNLEALALDMMEPEQAEDLTSENYWWV